MAAFGLITMSSNVVDSIATTMNIMPDYYYEIPEYDYGEVTVTNSSILSKQAGGDIVSSEGIATYVQKHDKMNVMLQITKIRKHISNFDFEEEYEAI